MHYSLPIYLVLDSGSLELISPISLNLKQPTVSIRSNELHTTHTLCTHYAHTMHISHTMHTPSTRRASITTLFSLLLIEILITGSLE